MELDHIKATGKILPFAFLLFLALILFVGLWPFDPWSENRVSPLDGSEGLRFEADGIVLSSGGEAEWIQSLFKNKAISIELWVRPAAESSGGVSSIVAFYDSQSEKSFFVGQWKSHLLVRTQTSHTVRGGRNYREIGLREGLVAGREHFLTITSDSTGTRIYSEGKPARVNPAHQVFPEDAVFGRIILGNNAAGKQGWSGDILGLGLYSRSLTTDEVLNSFSRWKDGSRISLHLEGTVGLYCFQEAAEREVKNCWGGTLNLLIPETFAPPRKILLSHSWDHLRHGWSSIQDVIVNIAGFIPFGFLTCALLLRRRNAGGGLAFIHAVLIGALLSFTIEILQAWLPSRDSSLADLAFNTLGTALGAAACWLGSTKDAAFD